MSKTKIPGKTLTRYTGLLLVKYNTYVSAESTDDPVVLSGAKTSRDSAVQASFAILQVPTVEEILKVGASQRVAGVCRSLRDNGEGT